MSDLESLEQIAVCVCTYRRPLQLARLLKALAAQARPAGTRFVIVDNDGNDERIGVVVRRFQEACRAPVTFIVEGRPGLSVARNAALRAARAAGAGIVALIDDDEWPSEHWLARLMDTRRQTGAAVVGGPVHPVFEGATAPPLRYRPLWSVQEGRLRNAPHVYCTCNSLVDLDAVRFLGDEPFSSAFSFTGGEDVVFFRRLHAAGIRMAWSKEAVVFEGIPAERATFRWLRRRWYRLGNVGVRCEKAAPVAGDVPPLAKTFILALRLVIYPLFRRRTFTAPVLWLLEAERVRGRLASHAGFTLIQYGEEPVRESCLY